MILDRAPIDWKRPKMPDWVKLQVVINQMAKSAVSQEPFLIAKEIRFDHRPPLWERKFDTDTNDTVPPCNAPLYIEAITDKEHDVRTNGPGGDRRITTRGSDTHNRNQARRLNENPYRPGLKPDQQPEAGKPKRLWSKRKMQSRNDLKGKRRFGA